MGEVNTRPVVDWHAYDQFDWSGARQSPMTEDECAAVTELAADVLELSPADRGVAWGNATPPGRYAATVIQVLPGVNHRYRERAAASQWGDIGVKVFKTTRDARREAERVVPFHRSLLHRLPGLPNTRVQGSLDAGNRSDACGSHRAFIVQQWVDGDTLEELIRRRWRTEPASGAVIRSVLEQLFRDIVIPLWREGTIWWDVRDANYCYAGRTGRLCLIDIDSLAAYADEILQTPHVWAKRDKGRATALARLRQMAVRLVLAQALRGSRKVEVSLVEVWRAELEPALSRLGKGASHTTDAEDALRRFFDQLDARGLLSAPSTVSD